MFYNCSSLLSLDISNFNLSKASNINYMFYDCKSLKSLNLSIFENHLFEPIQAIKIFIGINNNFVYCITNESKIPEKIISQLANYTNNCSKICLDNSRKIQDSDKSCVFKCQNSQYEFNNICYEACPYGVQCELICDTYYSYNKTECLEKIPDGYYVKDSILKTIDKCDQKCKSCSKESNEYNRCLSCNNDNGYYYKINDFKINNSFILCYNNVSDGYYLDKNNSIYKLCYPTCKKCEELGDEYNNKCLECMDNAFQFFERNVSNCYIKCDFYFYFDSSNKYHCTIKESCPIKYNKKIIERKQCIDDCSKDKIYRYEFNNICYKSYQNPTYNILNNSYISIEESSNNCLLNWNLEKFFNGYCNPFLLNNTNPLFKDEIIKNIGEDIINKNINLYDNQNNSILIIKDDDTLYQITSSDKENINKEENISSIVLGDCEEILKEKYKIDKNKALIILKIEYFKPENLIPIIGYEIFDPSTKEKLNLTYCSNVSINLNISVSIDENNLFKYDPNSEYYTDECNPYTTKDGTDILLNDRHKEFNNNNLSICENNCIL